MNFQAISCSLGLGMEERRGVNAGNWGRTGLFRFLCNALIASRKQTGTLEPDYCRIPWHAAVATQSKLEYKSLTGVSNYYFDFL